MRDRMICFVFTGHICEERLPHRFDTRQPTLDDLRKSELRAGELDVIIWFRAPGATIRATGRNHVLALPPPAALV